LFSSNATIVRPKLYNKGQNKTKHSITIATHFRAAERLLPHEITRCHLPLDTRDHIPFQSQPGRPVLDLPSSEGWKAELALVVGYRPTCIPKRFTRWKTVTHSSSNRAKRRTTLLIGTNVLISHYTKPLFLTFNLQSTIYFYDITCDALFQGCEVVQEMYVSAQVIVRSRCQDVAELPTRSAQVSAQDELHLQKNCFTRFAFVLSLLSYDMPLC